MKKLTISSVWAMPCPKRTSIKQAIALYLLLVLYGSCPVIAFAQQSNTKLQAQPAALQIGDKLPANFWTIERQIMVQGQALGQQNLQPFKGRAMLLDFWASWCSACLKQFPKMNQLQAQFGKNLQILLVNSYSKDSLALLQSFLQKQEAPFRLPILAYDQAMANLFPVNSLPHYIWVGADGRIKAITTADALTVANLQRLIAGLELNLALKTN